MVLWLLISRCCMIEACYSSCLPLFPFVNTMCMVSTGIWPLASSWGRWSFFCCHRVFLKSYQTFWRNIWQGFIFLSPSWCLAHCASLTTGHNVFFLAGQVSTAWLQENRFTVIIAVECTHGREKKRSSTPFGKSKFKWHVQAVHWNSLIWGCGGRNGWRDGGQEWERIKKWHVRKTISVKPQNSFVRMEKYEI